MRTKTDRTSEPGFFNAASEFLQGLTVIGLASALPVLACGPDFPNSVLQGGDGRLLRAHVSDFRVELSRIGQAGAPLAAVISTQSFAGQTFQAEISELREALGNSGIASGELARICAEFQAVRETLQRQAEAVERWKQQAAFRSGATSVPRPQMAPVSLPMGLPAEFADYLAGSLAFHAVDTNQAQQAWENLLAQPPAQRRYRSTWAAFMLGKTWLETDPDRAARCFQHVRELVKKGFKDSLGLAAASYGWEAKLALARGEYPTAIRLYLLQHQTGDTTALVSLRMTLRKALSPRQTTLLPLAADPVAQRVVTAYLVSHPQFECWDDPGLIDIESTDERRDVTERWLEAVEEVGATEVDAADRLALAAYQSGLFGLAERWLNHAQPNAAMAQWLRAKLLLRAGKTEEAAKRLAQVVRLFPREGDWPPPPALQFSSEPAPHPWDARSPVRQAMGELGALQLARRQYYEALDTLLRSGYWSDAAYVAEYVLTPDELAAYVERQWPQPDPSTGEEPQPIHDHEGNVRPEAAHLEIRYLTGRRLARLERWDEAAEFLPAQWRARLELFVQWLQRGRAPEAPADHRAHALWEAAQLARHQGMELFGTEVEPDWHLFKGQFDWGHLTALRGEPADQPGALADYASDRPEFRNREMRLAPGSVDEQRRILRHKPRPDERFHYRYRAAELAWEASQLMPDNTEATARLLWTAGSWLKTRDPQTADLFYKALVRRCGQTALGQEADRLRWFPKTESAPPSQLLEEFQPGAAPGWKGASEDEAGSAMPDADLNPSLADP